MANENQQQAAAAAKPAERKVPELRADRIRQSEFVHNTHIVMIPHGTRPEDLLGEAYWAHLAHALRRWDLIDCIWEDGWGEVRGIRVLSVGHAWVKVYFDPKRAVIEYPAIDLKQRTPGYRVEYVNNFARWSVIRESDKKVLKDQCDTEGDAHGWLANHLKSLSSN